MDIGQEQDRHILKLFPADIWAGIIYVTDLEMQQTQADTLWTHLVHQLGLGCS